MKHFPPLDTNGFRKCQINAINNLDQSFADNRPKALVQMAAGAGKTFTAITAAYRLLKYGKMKRILFLVDTKGLGEQAEREFLAYMPNDDPRSFSQIYGVRRLKSSYIPNDIQICICTIQRMYSILKGETLDEKAEETPFAEYVTAESKAPKEVVYNAKYPPEFFDCIIVDECHRSIYNVQPTSRNLYLENSDMVGWIQIEGTSIDYPVMQTPADPNYYLKHDFEKNYTDYGCPFMQADCDALAPSDNLIIYGHNMKDGSMFADLAKYGSKDFWQAHKIVRFDTALGSSAYEIFAVIHTTVQADAADAFPFYLFVDAAAPEDFADYVSACQARALYDTGISAEYGDKLLTLSTCDNITDNGRLLVIAKQTKTE